MISINNRHTSPQTQKEAIKNNHWLQPHTDEFLQELKKDVDFQSKIAQNVENTGTYLKYFGSKRDTVYVKNLLVGVKVVLCF